jgi:hypothetical protein
MRYADNMARLFIVGGAALLATALAAGLLGLQPTAVFGAAGAALLAALALYYPPRPWATRAPPLPLAIKAL